jgi:hypothetical protein
MFLAPNSDITCLASKEPEKHNHINLAVENPHPMRAVEDSFIPFFIWIPYTAWWVQGNTAKKQLDV